MGCLCAKAFDAEFESVSLEIQYFAGSEYLIWHRYCTMCRQDWFVKIELQEEGRQIFVSREDWVREKNE
jgi:hypothetical protein